jgi:Flp pilus assembly protein TadG
MSRRRGTARGQALAEFALALPIFALLLFAVIDLGRLVYTANAMSNGAREGARIGSVGSRPSPTCDGLSRVACVTEVTASNSWGIPKNAVTTTVTCERIAVGDTTPNSVAPNTCTTNDLLKVRAETTFTLVTPVIAQFIGNLTLSGEARVTVNN